MCTNRWRIGVVLALGGALTGTVSAGSDERQTNKLAGIVVSKADGRPAAYVPVVLAQSASGYIYIAEEGLTAGGDHDTILQYFAQPNSRHFGQVTTDIDGRFTLTSLAAPDQAWIVVAGDPVSGYALRTICPQDCGVVPLKLELEKPAYLNVKVPRPTAKSLMTMVNIGLAPPTPPTGPPEAAGTPAPETNDTDTVHIAVPSQRLGSQKPLRVGPLPGGQKYKVTAMGYGQKLPYQATLLQLIASPAPGETLDVVLESTAPGTLTGTITDTDEKPLSAVNVMVKTADGLVVGTLTDEAGKYELRGVPAGTHNLELLRHAKRMVPG